MASSDFLETSIRYKYAEQIGSVLPRLDAGSGGRGGAAKPVAPVAKAANAPATQAVEESTNHKELHELCKRRFFYRQAFDIYGGVAGFYTYGPPGCALKNNIVRQWRQWFVTEENMMEIEDTCIMPHAVLKASGHVERFNDFMVKDVIDESKFYRADKLLEEVMEEKMADPACTDEQRKEYTIVKNQADAYSQQEIGDVFKKYQIKSPETGNDLSDPYEFNLMFPTPIGPGGYLDGYLRPETAQGIFLNYKYCIEQNSNRLPFGVAQVGKSFRNEIAPRAGLTRQREFTQMEIEYFVNPKNKEHPKFKNVVDQVMSFFDSDRQLAGEEPVKVTMGEAFKAGFIKNQILGYFLARTHAFLVSVGVTEDRIRFRQHLPTEMAHYASDCWDVEVHCYLGWLEIVGTADRSAFDLTVHAKATKSDLTYKEVLDKPIEQEVLAITKQTGIAVMKAFKKDGRMMKEWLETMEQADLEELAALKGSKTVTVDGREFEISSDMLAFERKKEKISVTSFTPGVIEPSFGLDRIITVVLDHSYYARPADADDKQVRGVLRLPAAIAPYKCAILPLDQRIARHDKYVELNSAFRTELSALGVSSTTDESGATIGRRYARNDELGIPFAVTFDFTTLEDSTVTMRERDDMGQIRLPIASAAQLIRDLCTGEARWSDALQRYKIP